MGQRRFTININPFVLTTAYRRATETNQSPEQLLNERVTAYANGETVTVQPLLSPETTSHEVTIHVPDKVLGAALQRLQREGKSVEQVFVDLLTAYAQSAPIPTETEPVAEPAVVDGTIAGESYGSIPIVGAPTDRPADQHGDINLTLRGYALTTAPAQLIDMNGPTDSRAPQLHGLFADRRTPTMVATYRVHQWQWASPPNPGTRGNEITDFEATLIALQSTPSETLHVPNAGYDIGRGFQVMVLYAAVGHVTLVYTGEDTVAHGYALHVEGIIPEPTLLTLYQNLNANGRRELPGLRAGQPFGRAQGTDIKIAIRDTGRFMDPRTRKDWWRG